jgi:hypothetical protein
MDSRWIFPLALAIAIVILLASCNGNGDGDTFPEDGMPPTRAIELRAD